MPSRMLRRFLCCLTESNTAFFVAVYMLFFMLFFNRGIFISLYLATLLGFMLLYPILKKDYAIFVHYLWIPFLFFAYIALTPGMLFKDISLSGTMFFSFIVGVSFAIFLKDKLWHIGCGMLFALIASLIIFVVRGFPKDMLWNGRMRLFFDHPSVLSFITGLLFLCSGDFSRGCSWKCFFGNRHLPPLLGPIFFGNYRVWRNTFKSTLCS